MGNKEHLTFVFPLRFSHDGPKSSNNVQQTSKIPSHLSAHAGIYILPPKTRISLKTPKAERVDTWITLEICPPPGPNARRDEISRSREPLTPTLGSAALPIASLLLLRGRLSRAFGLPCFFDLPPASFSSGLLPQKHQIATKTVSYERYSEILFQKVALCYLLHFVQDGCSKNALKK